MEFQKTSIPDVIIIEPKIIEDDRGVFSELFNKKTVDVTGADFVQENASWSRLPGTVRGLHFQRPPKAQGKLVRVVRGRIFDVAVDLRAESPTFLSHVGVELSPANWRQLWIPPGFAHGFMTLEPDTEVIYKVTAPYAEDLDAGVRWDDPQLAIRWPGSAGGPRLSPKDRSLPRFADIDNPF